MRGKGLIECNTKCKETIVYKAMYVRIPIVRQKCSMLLRYVSQNKDHLKFEGRTAEEVIEDLKKDLAALDTVENLLEGKIRVFYERKEDIYPYI